jgi:hypothetical protein
MNTKIEFSREEALFELRFWLEMLGDHIRLIYDSMSPKEVTNIQQAGSLMNRYDDLLERARQPVSDQQLGAVLSESKQAGEQLRVFKLKMLEKHLIGKVATSLPPSFYAHMVDEVDEFLRLLSYFVQGQTPPAVHPLHHDLLWLLDASGHADAIHDRLDFREEKLKEKVSHFVKDFATLYLKAVDLNKYLRSGVFEFPALDKFHRDVEPEMLYFQNLLRVLEELRLNKETLGVLMPLHVDHMFREECYYLIKLSQTGQVKRPTCDPAKPRTEG